MDTYLRMFWGQRLTRRSEARKDVGFRGKQLLWSRKIQFYPSKPQQNLCREPWWLISAKTLKGGLPGAQDK
jgi:hypothetical protein